ncbi:BON domain-containing protein [Aquisalimonas asiatica]|uniref:Osmotically-inducible protein OsmY, contains BON domain n=1 Tax=Aquisalimonas asiatica TaxID=406100 RepID=A0A1H8S8J2_9GAMM|nr:BON domain-containing protein [Aquisalimonas asiatica]SEO74846.1 Osmotically-inducible protein OsmY, contains BON domain [Aquisalimonas asiatica]
MANRRYRAATIALLLGASLAVAGCAGTGDNGDAETEAALDSRSFMDRLSDQRIRSRIQAEILSDDDLRHASNIRVTVFEGIALLTGEVPSREVGQRIARLAREESGARHVHNELVIAEMSSVFARSRDRFISARASTRLLSLNEPEDLDRDRVYMITNRGRIYLMGRVTRDEAEAITEKVRRIAGVREVVRAFEYVD